MKKASHRNRARSGFGIAAWLLSLALFCPPASAFGPATHATVAYHVAQHLGGPDPLLLAAFRGGANQPDMFTLGGYDWGLSHTLELAEIMLEIATTDVQRALAYGFACHIRADSAGHGHCIPSETLEHTAVELSLDILLYHSPDPAESAAALESTVVWDAPFLSEAIAIYNARHGNPYPEIPAEEIDRMGDLHRSLLELKNVMYADPGWLAFAEQTAPPCWREECFNDAVTRSVSWINAHPLDGVFASGTAAAGQRTRLGPVAGVSDGVPSAGPDQASGARASGSGDTPAGFAGTGLLSPASDYSYPFESPDTDGDGVPDCGSRDNCPEDWNPEQTDGDGDGWGEACECDDGNAAIHPGAAEVPGNGLDDDCDPSTPDQTAWSAAEPAEASSRGTAGFEGSRVVNPLMPLVVSLAAVLAARTRRRRQASQCPRSPSPSWCGDSRKGCQGVGPQGRRIRQIP